VLIVIAQFHTTEGVVDTAAHDEIKRAIEREAGDLNLRVEVAPTSLKADDRDGAQTLGDRYDASIVIWGADTGVRVSVNFYNRKQPDLLHVYAADVQIEETTRTQIAEPSKYAEFVTKDLPRQLTFLALFSVGQSYYAREEYIESAHVIEKSVDVLSQSQISVDYEGVSDAYFRLGWLFQVPLGDIHKAQTAYTHALALNPKSAEGYNNRGVTYTQMGKFEQAFRDYDHALEIDPDLTNAYVNRGATYYKIGDYEQALSNFSHALEINPSLAIVYNNRGATYGEVGAYEYALRDYNRALELNPEFPEALYGRGYIYHEIGEIEQSLSDYTSVLELEPDNFGAYNNRGNIYHDIGEVKRALVDYTRALEINQEDAQTF
jgi:tetratricopeptide (TPR) repeat protein